MQFMKSVRILSYFQINSIKNFHSVSIFIETLFCSSAQQFFFFSNTPVFFEGFSKRKRIVPSLVTYASMAMNGCCLLITAKHLATSLALMALITVPLCLPSSSFLL